MKLVNFQVFVWFFILLIILNNSIYQNIHLEGCSSFHIFASKEDRPIGIVATGASTALEGVYFLASTAGAGAAGASDAVAGTTFVSTSFSGWRGASKSTPLSTVDLNLTIGAATTSSVSATMGCWSILAIIPSELGTFPSFNYSSYIAVAWARASFSAASTWIVLYSSSNILIASASAYYIFSF